MQKDSMSWYVWISVNSLKKCHGLFSIAIKAVYAIFFSFSRSNVGNTFRLCNGLYRISSCLNRKFSPPPIKGHASIFQYPRDLLDQCEADQCSLLIYKRIRREHLGRKPQTVGEGPRSLLRWLPCHSLFTIYHLFPLYSPFVATNTVLILYGTWGVTG